MNYKNQLVLTGALDDVGAPIRATSGKSYRLGLEVDAEVQMSNHFTIHPNAAFSSNRNKDFFAPSMVLLKTSEILLIFLTKCNYWKCICI